MPFSSGSGVRFLEISPMTPLSFSGIGSLIRSAAFSNSSSTGMDWTWGFSLGTVWAPQSQRQRMVLAPHSGHTRTPTDAFTAPAFFLENVLPFSSFLSDWAERATVSTKRCAPPALPTGNSTCGGGLSNLSLAFSGRAILVPIRVTARGLTLTPMFWETASMVVAPARSDLDMTMSPSRPNPSPVSRGIAYFVSMRSSA